MEALRGPGGGFGGGGSTDGRHRIAVDRRSSAVGIPGLCDSVALAGSLFDLDRRNRLYPGLAASPSCRFATRVLARLCLDQDTGGVPGAVPRQSWSHFADDSPLLNRSSSANVDANLDRTLHQLGYPLVLLFHFFSRGRYREYAPFKREPASGCGKEGIFIFWASWASGLWFVGRAC